MTLQGQRHLHTKRDEAPLLTSIYLDVQKTFILWKKMTF